jgi:hypothetical protein
MMEHGGGPTPGSRVGAATAVSEAYTKDLNMRFNHDATMMSNKETVRTIRRQDILTLLVIALACATAVLLLYILP